MSSTLLPMFDHMAWADARAIEVLRTSSSEAPNAQAQRLLAHVVAAERVWWLRLRGEDAASVPIWPEWSVEQVAEVAAENARGYRELAAALGPEEAARLIEYRNSQGTLFRTAVRDILLQVVLHGSYHRGQIALVLRASGRTPVNTDYITYARELQSR